MKDKLIENLIKKEIKRQDDTLNLIPSENYVSGGVLRALGSPLTNKYAEGYPGARYYGGNAVIDEIENLCKERALKLFKLSPRAWHVNVQAYSGSPANLAVYFGFVPFGEKIMGLRLDMGGHLTHGHKVSITGQAWKSVQYGVNRKTELLDYSEIMKIAKREKPKLIIAGYTAYPRIIDFKKFRKIADVVGAYFMVDMSHFAGLVAGGVYPSPFKYADVVTTTTHKTLRGPRAALIFCKKELASKIDKAVFPGLQGGPHANQIASTAVALYEAMQPSFKKYAKQVVKNVKALAEELKRQGFRLVSGGTDTHLVLLDLRDKGITGREVSDRLEAQGIIVNKNTIPFDPRPPMDPSGIRLGTPALTTRGMKEREMKIIGNLIGEVLSRGKNVSLGVKKLCRDFPLKYSKGL
ncbi:MAG: serine hydroxymethyltransferase [Candidatus Liptonbacteria bacterium]|nr:serine hydroxymethyltransferase [Candidatus Liptonbacteria bacterium]